MIAENEFEIRLLHDIAKQGNAAVAVPVDDVAEHIQRVRIGEVRLVKQSFELVHGIAVKIGDGESQTFYSSKKSAAISLS